MKSILLCLAFVGLVACAPAANEPTGPLLSINIPSGPTVRVAGARVIAKMPANLEASVKRFYTSDPNLLEKPVLLENVNAASLEAAFRKDAVFVQSRWSYLGVQLRTWPLGAVQRVVAIVLEADQVAYVGVHRGDLNAPFSGREIARRLTTLERPFFVDAEKLGSALGFRLQAPSIAGFEYELRRENRTDPSTDDVFNFNIGSTQARYAERRERRFPPSSGEALAVQLGSNPLVLLTKPRRSGSGAQLGLEVAGLLGACDLESLSADRAMYDCDGRRFDLPVSR
jgi:hypothetical protein